MPSRPSCRRPPPWDSVTAPQADQSSPHPALHHGLRQNRAQYSLFLLSSALCTLRSPLRGLDLCRMLFAFPGKQSRYASSLFGAVAVLLALRKRRVTGEGSLHRPFRPGSAGLHARSRHGGLFLNDAIARPQASVYGSRAFPDSPLPGRPHRGYDTPKLGNPAGADGFRWEGGRPR